MSLRCIKCKVNPGKIVIRHAVYCKGCFIPLVASKFRRSLGTSLTQNTGSSKRPNLEASGSLLLGFSGGLGSSVLLHLVYKTFFAYEPSANGEPPGGIHHPRTANVWTSCTVCYVEVCSAFPERRDRTIDIMEALAPYPKFHFLPLRLEFAFDNSWWRSVTTTGQSRSQLAIELGKDGLFTQALRPAASHHLPPVDALRTYLKSLPSQTAVSSAIRTLVRLLLSYTARSRRASHLLLGTSLTTLSISLISCISQGGGHSILEEFQEEWDTGMPAASQNIGALRVVRPLRDVTMKECSIFAWWNSIHVVGRDPQTRATAGIPGLTKDFIVGLEKDYPSTVSTIVRTCAKLEPKCASLGLCVLCQRPIQEGLDHWKSRISIRSYSDSKLGSDLAYSQTPAPSDIPTVSATSDQAPSVSTQLCYFCRTTLTSRGSWASRPTLPGVLSSDRSPPSAPLPVWVSASYGQPPAQDEEPKVSGNGELWVQRLQDEATQLDKIADCLLDS